MSEPVTKPNDARAVRSGRIFEAAFAISAVAVIASIPLTTALGQPDLPGFALIGTGVVASILSFQHTPSRLVLALIGLIVMMAILVAVHILLHQYGMAHNWLDPIYIGVVGVYSITALLVGIRSLVQNRL